METDHMKSCLNPTCWKSSVRADLSWSLREKLSVSHVTWLPSSEMEQKRQIDFRWSWIYKETSPTLRQASHKGAVRGARHWHLRTCQHSITFPAQGGDLVPTCDCPPKISTVGLGLGWINGSRKHQTLTPEMTLHFSFTKIKHLIVQVMYWIFFLPVAVASILYSPCDCVCVCVWVSIIMVTWGPGDTSCSMNCCLCTVFVSVIVSKQPSSKTQSGSFTAV